MHLLIERAVDLTVSVGRHMLNRRLRIRRLSGRRGVDDIFRGTRHPREPGVLLNRQSDDFPNPILRLGKDASNFSKLLKKSAVERLQVNQRVVRRERPHREKALEEEREALTAGLDESSKAYAAIDLLEIAELERDISRLVGEVPHAQSVFQDQRLSALVDDFGVVADFVRSQPVLTALVKWRGSHPRRLAEIANLGTAGRLVGHFYVHNGDDSGFVCDRA
jgi:hypothetical protein